MERSVVGVMSAYTFEQTTLKPKTERAQNLISDDERTL